MLIDFNAIVESHKDEITQDKKPSNELDAMSESVSSLVKKAESLNVQNRNTAITALEMAMQARKIRKEIDSVRKRITQPHVDFQKAIKKLADSYSSKLEELENRLIGKLDDYRKDGDDFTQITCDEGSLRVSAEISFEVEDKDQVPTEYLTVDTKLVEAALKGGVRNIPGIKIHTKEKLSCRVKN